MRAPRLITWLLLLLPTLAAAQGDVPALERWVASVDTASQQLVLSWNPSPHPYVMGYHISTGDTNREYAIVYGRFDTTYVCADHSPLERHIYAIHVFDSAGNVSSLTPQFGNMVLQADVPECSTAVTAVWTPYVGMPGGVARYVLLVKQEPFDTGFVPQQYVAPDGILEHSFHMAPGATHVSLVVKAEGQQGILSSMSNIVSVTRRTVDSADHLAISSITYDSIDNTVTLLFDVDTSYRSSDYTLWRSVDGAPFTILATLPPPLTAYVDRDISRFDSIYMYQLSVTDACGFNERYSESRHVVVPDPPAPAVAIPNAVLVGDDGPNGCFLPDVRGLMGNLYELYIYDRNGNLIYHTDDPRSGWRPTPATPQGAYAYSLRLRFNTNDIATYTGTILVLR